MANTTKEAGLMANSMEKGGFSTAKERGMHNLTQEEIHVAARRDDG